VVLARGEAGERFSDRSRTNAESCRPYTHPESSPILLRTKFEGANQYAYKVDEDRSSEEDRTNVFEPLNPEPPNVHK